MVELIKVQLFIMFMNQISRREAGESEPSVDFLFLPVQRHLWWLEHVPVPVLVAQKLAYLWSAHHCKSASSGSVSQSLKSRPPADGSFKLQLCYFCSRLLFKLLHTPETGVIVKQPLSLLIIQPLYWTERSHFHLKIETGTWHHLSVEWFKQTHLPHTRWPSLPLCFCQAPAPTRCLFLSSFWGRC